MQIIPQEWDWLAADWRVYFFMKVAPEYLVVLLDITLGFGMISSSATYPENYRHIKPTSAVFFAVEV